MSSDEEDCEFSTPLSPLLASPFLSMPSTPLTKNLPGKNFADNPQMREKLKTKHGDTFNGLLGKSNNNNKKAFMTEAAALERENEEVDVDELLKESIASGVTSLDISYYKLRELPEKVLDLQDTLQTLIARNNMLVRLSDNFGVLSGLTHLDLQCNRLTEVPASLSMLENLQHLNLSNNCLSALPEEFEDLTSLQVVYLDINYLTAFPTVLLRIRTVLKLFIVENAGIGTIPPIEAFSQCNPCILIHMDNTPEISRQWEEQKARLPSTITMQWNKIWPDKVMEGLYMGSLRAVQHEAVFRELRITNVVTCGRNLQIANIPEGVRRLVLEVDDSDEENLKAHFLKAIDFMNVDLKATPRTGNVLVHCFAGVSRSATIVLAYLIYEKQMSFVDALKLLRTSRPAANPNPNFCRQLQDWEKYLSGENYLER